MRLRLKNGAKMLQYGVYGLLIDLLLVRRRTLVVGGGRVGERKVLQLLDAGAEVTVASKDFTENLLKLGRAGKVKMEKVKVEEGFIARLKSKPKVVIVSLNDRLLNKKLAKEAKTVGALVCVVDDPSLSDFAMPAVAKVGDIRVGISTRGSSPAMAGIIRRRVERMVTQKDLLQIELQKYARPLAKRYISSPDERGKVLQSIIGSGEVNKFLEDEDMVGARGAVKKIIVKASCRGRGG